MNKMFKKRQEIFFKFDKNNNMAYEMIKYEAMRNSLSDST